MKELWTPADDAAVERFRAAVSRADLLASLHAIEGVDGVTARDDVRWLDAWGTRAMRTMALAPDPTAADQARVLAHVLHKELGFMGDADDYDHPDNSLLHRVLGRRKGLPILLSIVWIEVGRRSGVPVAGVGMPGHFIVRVGGASGVLVDPFGGGRVWSKRDCAEKLREISDGAITLKDEMLRETPFPAILERVLQNLLGSYARRGDDGGRFRATTFLAALRPDSPERLLENADVAGAVGLPDLAAKLLREVVERFPDAEEAEQAANRLEDGTPPPVVN